jgi:soluble lytic murein transglycosylase-like protein
MDGDVNTYSRPAVVCRLWLYFCMIIAAAILLSPVNSTGVYNFGAADSGTDPELADSPAGTAHDAVSPVPDSAVSSRRLMEDEPDPAAVKVKMRYSAIIKQAGQRHGVEAALIKAIIMAESSYNPRAVSNRGAAGLMQLMPTTALSMGIKDRFDPVHNIDGGVRYFKKMLVRFDGDTRLALAAYNAGARKVRRYNGIPPFKTTRTYIDKVFQYYERYKDLENDASNEV